MSGILTFDTFQAGAVLLVFMVAGDWLAKKLKGRLPSVLIAGLLFMLVSWTGVLPENLMELGGFIPCPDHRIAPDAIYENVQYYCDKMQNLHF